MKLSSPPQAYSAQDEANCRSAIEGADAENHKRGQDIQVGRARVILTDTATTGANVGKRYSLTILNGSVTVVAL